MSKNTENYVEIIKFLVSVNKSEVIQSIICLSLPLPKKLFTNQISQIFSKLYSQQKLLLQVKGILKRLRIKTCWLGNSKKKMF